MIGQTALISKKHNDITDMLYAKERDKFLSSDLSSGISINNLIKYIDPKNPRHAKEESETLVTLGDLNHDGKLSLDEILAKMDLFLGSKMVDTARSFHDEF